ncbi:hypothetical protein JRY29_04435 [Salmonella enterica subsp. enterica serovar Kentucky]|nr:hypothetical protein JRY29_04435 [Salmonella enterica subsp. enterica serovar Kentucky]
MPSGYVKRGHKNAGWRRRLSGLQKMSRLVGLISVAPSGWVTIKAIYSLSVGLRVTEER